MDKFLTILKQMWQSRDLRNRLMFTLAILFFIRIVGHIPLPGIDKTQLANFLSQSENQVFGVLSMFTGGSIYRLSIDLIGVGPYITASIIVQLLTKVIPSWEAIQKEGTSGQERLNSYTRYLTPFMALVQGYGMIALLKSQSVLTIDSTFQLVTMLASIMATSIFVMWLGELISERGLGNGISLIIALGIVSGFPQQIANTAATTQGTGYWSVLIFGAMFLITIAVIVLVNGAERRVPIIYSRRAAGYRASTGVESFLPIKVNLAGVIPIIFALSFLTFPLVIARFLTTAKSEMLVNFATNMTNFINNSTYYSITYFLLVLIFTFFYTYIVFQPEQVAENVQKQGGFIPGIRPGKEMVYYLKFIISRITVIGALFLAFIAVLPFVVKSVVDIPTLTIGGTSILIVVSVILETSRTIAGQLTMHRYDTIE